MLLQSDGTVHNAVKTDFTLQDILQMPDRGFLAVGSYGEEFKTVQVLLKLDRNGFIVDCPYLEHVTVRPIDNDINLSNYSLQATSYGVSLGDCMYDTYDNPDVEVQTLCP